MGKSVDFGVANVARKVKNIDFGVANVARKVKSGEIGVANVARQFFQAGTPLGDLALGTIIKLNVSGTAREFIVVNQGLPSSAYDSSCNGTWLMIKGLYTSMYFDGTNNDYQNSDVHAYLNGTFLSSLDSNIQSLIKTVKIPYVNGTGQTGSLATGSSGLSTKIFLPSVSEVSPDCTTNHLHFGEGSALGYFSDTSEDLKTKRLAYENGGTTARAWWLRSPYKYSSSSAGKLRQWAVTYTGGTGQFDGTTTGQYLRPMMILPSTAIIDDSGNITS